MSLISTNLTNAMNAILISLIFDDFVILKACCVPFAYKVAEQNKTVLTCMITNQSDLIKHNRSKIILRKICHLANL